MDVILESQRLIYKPLSCKHLSIDYVNWLNDNNVIRYLETGGNYTLKMLSEYLKEVEKKNIYFWAIHLKESDKHIGNIKIDPINMRHGLGEYGIMMGDSKEWGKGYAYEASDKIIQYSFEDIGLRKLTLGVVEDNIAALTLYHKLRFSVEGVYKEHGLYEGKYCNVIRMAIFNRGNEK